MPRHGNSPDRELHEITHELRHVVNDEKHEGPGDTRRRGYAHRRRDLTQRAETLLWFLVEEPTHEQWRAYVRGGEKPPELQQLPSPLLFKGRAQGGMVIEIPRNDHGEEVTIDGTVEHGKPEAFDAGAAYRMGDRIYHETFDAPESALGALRDFLTVPKSSPPVRWARALLLDGIIDTNFGLTDRGRRLWHRRFASRAQSGVELR